jgi:hypothetical protein
MYNVLFALVRAPAPCATCQLCTTPRIMIPAQTHHHSRSLAQPPTFRTPLVATTQGEAYDLARPRLIARVAWSTSRGSRDRRGPRPLLKTRCARSNPWSRGSSGRRHAVPEPSRAELSATIENEWWWGGAEARRGLVGLALVMSSRAWLAWPAAFVASKIEAPNMLADLE